jgi:hypothetical protein
MARRRIDPETGEQDLKGVTTTVRETKATGHEATEFFKTTRVQPHSIQAPGIVARLAALKATDLEGG